jgi:hypothetical protein
LKVSNNVSTLRLLFSRVWSDMAVLLVEGWAHPHATSRASASPVVVRFDLDVTVIEEKLGRPTFSGQ